MDNVKEGDTCVTRDASFMMVVLFFISLRTDQNVLRMFRLVLKGVLTSVLQPFTDDN